MTMVTAIPITKIIVAPKVTIPMIAPIEILPLRGRTSVGVGDEDDGVEAAKINNDIVVQDCRILFQFDLLHNTLLAIGRKATYWQCWLVEAVLDIPDLCCSLEI